MLPVSKATMADETSNGGTPDGDGRVGGSRRRRRNRNNRNNGGRPSASGNRESSGNNRHHTSTAIPDENVDRRQNNNGNSNNNNNNNVQKNNQQKQSNPKGSRGGPNQSSNNNRDAMKKHGRKRHSNANQRGSSNGPANKDRTATINYPSYKSLEELQCRYNQKDPELIRGTIRVLPARNAMAFCTCDRGSQHKDVVLETPLERNRALDGDVAFVELLPIEDETEEGEIEDNNNNERITTSSSAGSGNSRIETFHDQDSGVDPENKDGAAADAFTEPRTLSWQDNQLQVDLWDPTVPMERRELIPRDTRDDGTGTSDGHTKQRRGRVVYVIPPRQHQTEIKSPSSHNKAHDQPKSNQVRPTRRIIGTLKRLQGGTTLLTSSNKSLDQFRLSKNDAAKFKDAPEDAIFQAKYTYGSWKEDFRWPPCSDVDQFGMSGNVEDETAALLIENDVDHGDFPPSVLEECQAVVADGEYSNGSESGWKPTPAMYKGRRDYRKQRIFTIDPTTAKDLDDALHITDLGNGEVEIGVHIADVSHFVQPNSQIDLEAQRRCTTVYLVDRTIPMLPRPLCEIACSLNENVERLAFSCVWRMKKDGTLVKNQQTWYGRSVIKSCARLDYSTAQNIIENKVAFGENGIDEELWPLSRRPTGGHTIEQVAADVRLMNLVAQSRRSLRMQNGALALNAVKLTFKLDDDRETPLMCEPYPIRDSNKLVEEYMLLANYLVAQRLITHTGGRACLRHHEPPLFEGLEKTAELAKEALGFRIDISSSESLQRSLNRLSRQCADETVLKCVTELLKAPMRPANYIAAGEIPREAWAHFALHIPYYTHFTSPIRRYADVIVHRLLQASIDGQEAVDNFNLTETEIGTICGACNAKKDGSRKAQERSDVVFLALYLRRFPMKSQMGIVVSVGEKAFTVFLPALGTSALLYLEEHKNWIDYTSYEAPNVGKRIKLTRTQKHKGEVWKEIVIKDFCRLRVTCKCNDKPPISVKLELEGPWLDSD